MLTPKKLNEVEAQLAERIEAAAAKAIKAEASAVRELEAEVRQLTADRDRAREIAVALEQEVARVRELHSPEDRGTGEPDCKGCRTHVTFTPWPCKTITALVAGEAL